MHTSSGLIFKRELRLGRPRGRKWEDGHHHQYFLSTSKAVLPLHLAKKEKKGNKTGVGKDGMCLCLAKVQLWTPYSNFPNSADQSEMFSNLLLVLRASREAGWAVVASLSSLAFSASLKGNGFNLRYLDWIYRCLWEVRKERHKAYELAGFNNYMGPVYFWVHVWEKERE